MIGIFKMRSTVDSYIITDAAVLIYYTIAYITAVPNTNGWQTMLPVVPYLFNSFVIIDPHQVAAYNGGADSDPCSDAYHTAFNSRCIYDASFRDNCFFQGSTTNLSRRQHARTCIN